MYKGPNFGAFARFYGAKDYLDHQKIIFESKNQEKYCKPALSPITQKGQHHEKISIGHLGRWPERR